MKTVNLVQGSVEWHNFRREKFTASDAPAMLGLSKYKTRDQLLKEKKTGITPPVSDRQQFLFDKGHAAEASYRPILEEFIGDELYNTTGVSDDYDFLAASFDGITMDETVIFEHKLWNQSLADYIDEHDDLPDTHWPQVEHQMFVSGAGVCYFVVSDGTESQSTQISYESKPERAKQVIDGWLLFKKDLENYEVTEVKEKPKADTTFSLPVLSYQIDKTSLAIQTNLDLFKLKAKELVEESKKTLESDQDFANAESMVKTFKGAETRLADISTAVLGEVGSIDQFVKDLNDIKETIRQARLNTEKQVKNRKDEIKADLVKAAKLEILSYRRSDAPFEIRCWPQYDPSEATKNKRTIESLTSSVNQYVADAKLEMNTLIDLAEKHWAMVKGHEFLFSDIGVIFNCPTDEFKAIVDRRISDFKEQQEEIARQKEIEEQQRLEALEKQRIADEAAKVNRQMASTPLSKMASLDDDEDEDKQLHDIVRERVNNPARVVRIDDAELELKREDLIPESVKQKAHDFTLKMEQNGVIEETVTISRAEYDRLIKAEAKLQALEAFGVDNWDGYDEAMSFINSQQSDE